MSEVADIIRRVEALNEVTVARGAYPGEAANAQRLAQALVKRHGLEAHFNGHRPKSFVEDNIAENLHRNVDPVRAAAEEFWAAMRASGAKEEAVNRERAKWERTRTSRARTPSEDSFERARQEWEKARADFSKEFEDILHGRKRRTEANPYRWEGSEKATRKRRESEDRVKGYKGNHGTVRAVLRIGGGLPVTAKQLAAWYGGITFDAAHGRLWRAQMAGLLKKVKGGYVVA